jgi:hypothetical protein
MQIQQLNNDNQYLQEETSQETYQNENYREHDNDGRKQQQPNSSPETRNFRNETQQYSKQEVIVQQQQDNEERQQQYRTEQRRQHHEKRQDRSQKINGINNNGPRIQQTLPQYDTTPKRKNDTWGASINNLPPTIFCIYFQNINGLQLRTKESKWLTHLKLMKENGISISGLAETNTNWHQKHTKKEMSHSTQSIFTNYSLAFSENRFNPSNRNHYLPGGCLHRPLDQ